MIYTRSTTFLGIFIIISAIPIAFSIYQSSNAQPQDTAFNTINPLIGDTSNFTQKSPVQFSPEPILIVNGNNGLHIVWEEMVDGKSEIFYTKRTSEGFSYKINLSLSNAADSIKPSIQVENNSIYFTWWEKYDNGTQMPMFRASQDNGNTFGAVTTLSNLPY